MRATLVLTASLILSLTGAAFAQNPAAGGTMNNPGSVKSNGEKADDRTTGSAPDTNPNPGGRPSDHNGTADTLGKADSKSGAPAAPRP
ncbi:hypothetical protein [Methylobacterium sp. J-090]|uniref:hypothetical protein n=1 Tax=Methylobacterium sp. J-090 TaxID=2836666 RepID=UPI001FB9EDAD|nr:hypothetical protein [Methylobacterium sp. J-090]MCJ2083712.1 hypothetical protein [Methylobacterium sp. J-090]